MNHATKEIARGLRRARAELALTWRAIAAALGVSEPTLRRAARGGNVRDLTMARIVCGLRRLGGKP